MNPPIASTESIEFEQRKLQNDIIQNNNACLGVKNALESVLHAAISSSKTTDDNNLSISSSQSDSSTKDANNEDTNISLESIKQIHSDEDSTSSEYEDDDSTTRARMIWFIGL